MAEGKPPTPPQSELPPLTQPFPGSLTPGWNDPPSVQFNAQTSGASGRTKLNKRVPFPLQQGVASTKPTAIVQPCQTTTTATSNLSSGNIAVVHPLQYSTNQATPPHNARPPTLPACTNTIASTTLPRDSQTPPPLANVPTMCVPAVPRQNTGSDENAASATFPPSSVADQFSTSAIQHL